MSYRLQRFLLGQTRFFLKFQIFVLSPSSRSAKLRTPPRPVLFLLFLALSIFPPVPLFLSAGSYQTEPVRTNHRTFSSVLSAINPESPIPFSWEATPVVLRLHSFLLLQSLEPYQVVTFRSIKLSSSYPFVNDASARSRRRFTSRRAIPLVLSFLFYILAHCNRFRRATYTFPCLFAF